MKSYAVVCAVISFAAAVLVSGCASFEYVGRSFDSADKDAVIAWYTEKNPVPSGVYRVIGRGVLKFKQGDLDMYDVEERLIEEARKRGADAVMTGKIQVSAVGNYDVDNAPDPGAGTAVPVMVGVSANGKKQPINSLGGEITLSGEDSEAEQCTVNAVFYKKSDAVQKLIESSPVRVADKSEDKK